MRARLLLIGLVLLASITVTVVKARTAVDCNGTSTLTNIINTLAITDDTKAYIKSLHDARDIIDAQLEACQSGQVNNSEVTETPEPSNTPAPTNTAVVTLNAVQALQASRTAIADARTATASARGATATFVASYKPIDLREFKNYADKHMGEKVIIKGTIFNVDAEDKVIQINGNGNFSYDFYIALRDSPSGIYENDFVTVYGTVNGYYSYTTQNGNKAQEPQLIDAVVTKP